MCGQLKLVSLSRVQMELLDVKVVWSVAKVGVTVEEQRFFSLHVVVQVLLKFGMKLSLSPMCSEDMCLAIGGFRWGM